MINMMFHENRRLAVILCVFLLAVFFSCNLEYKYNIINFAALLILTAILSAVRFILRFVLKNSNKFNRLKIFCGYAAVLLLPAAVAVFFCVLHFNVSEKPVLDYLERYKDTPVYIKADIKRVSGTDIITRMDLKVYEINGEKSKKFNLSLTIFGEIEAETDNILETYVIFKNIEDNSAYQTNTAYLKSGGYYISAEYFEYTGDTEDREDSEGSDESPSAPIKITPVKSHSLTYYLEAANAYTKDVYFRNIKFDYHDGQTNEAALVYGILTGRKDYIDSRTQTSFRKTGISHILAVSGLHLAILCGIIFAFLNLFNVHKKISCIIIILCCLIFMAFTGFSLSVIRSGIMTVLFYSAFMFERKSDPVTSLFIAGFFVILLNPYNSLNIGFQLSFTATLGIVSTAGMHNKVAEKIQKIEDINIINKLMFLKFVKLLIKPLKIIVSSVFVTMAAVIFTLPITSYAFGTLSLISPLANLAASPLVTAILFLSLLIMIFSFFKVILFIFGLPLYFITKLLMYITEFMASFKYSYISVESTGSQIGSFYIFALIFLIILILCFYITSKLAAFNFKNLKKKRRKKLTLSILYISAAAAFLIMLSSLIYPRILFKDSVRVAYYSDDKNQNIILFQNDYDSADIIDISHGTLSHVKKTCDMLVENGAVNIDSIILTHYHKRHVQMIRRYASYLGIRKIYIPEPLTEYDIEVYNSLYYLSVNPNVGFELIKYGSSLKLGDITITDTIFDYNKMQHIIVNIIYSSDNIHKNFLYLGIGYEKGFSNYINDENSENYDVVFYGTHKHNRRDDNYMANVYGTFAGVLSSYLDRNKNKSSQKIELGALEKYISGGSVLFSSDDYNSITFEVNKKGEMKYYLK